MDDRLFKLCIGCGDIKPVAGFHRHRQGWHPRCKVCRSVRQSRVFTAEDSLRYRLQREEVTA
jgi:hypothetical protein